MREDAATAADLVEAIAVLRTAWQVDGVESAAEQVLRVRPSGRPIADEDPESTYAADVMRRLRQSPRIEVAGVGQGRVMRAIVRMNAGE